MNTETKNAYIKRAGSRKYFCGFQLNSQDETKPPILPQWTDQPWHCMSLTTQEAQQFVCNELRDVDGIMAIILPIR